MKITSLQKRSNNVFVVFDDGSKINIDYRIAVDNGLRKNDDLNEIQIEKMKTETEKLKIKDSAFRLLGRRIHSRQEIFLKLLKKGFNKNDILIAINDLKQKGYIDDLKFTKAFIEEKLNRKKSGLLKIKSGLIQKGVSKEIIETCLLEIDTNISLNNAIVLSEKKYKSLLERKTERSKIKQKLFAYLFSKGFQSEIISQAISKLNFEAEEDSSDL